MLRRTATAIDRTALFDRLLEVRTCMLRGLGGMDALLHVDLTMAQLKTLIYLNHAGVCQIGQVADGLGIGRPAASLLVDRLVQLGMVRRWEDTVDRRRTLTELTPAGNELATQMYEGSRQTLAHLTDQLSDDDLEALVQGVAALADVVNRASQPGEPALYGSTS